MSEGGRPKIAFVVQRCGEEVVGGAESLCVRIAAELAPIADVEILTTCARDYMTWRNEYPPGPTTVHGVPVRRFPVDTERDVRRFNALSRHLRDSLGSTTTEAEQQWMRAQGPISSALREYLVAHTGDYEWIGFFSYLYATSYLLLPLVANKAFLWPLAHDEWPLQLNMWPGFYRLPRRIAYVSPEERALVEARFPGCSPGCVMPLTIEAPPGRDPARFRTQQGIGDEPFALYLGRIDPAKGCPELFEFFLRHRAHGGRIRKLVALGERHMAVPQHPHILAPGRVSETVKWDALAAADVVIMPSAYESLSLTVLEAWAAGTPVLVNGATHVLVAQCRRAGGGLWYASFGEFDGALNVLVPSLAKRLGAQGRRYVADRYAAERVLAAYSALFETLEVRA